MPTDRTDQTDQSDQAESFADNWTYLKTELRWLDQVLMLAVARQRKENHAIERIAQSKADRASSSWWKGIIATDGKTAYDEHRQTSSGPKGTYQQQLENKIQASHQQGIVLALPALRDRLSLTGFEKNLVLMSIAPEINRRYARLYRYLQGENPIDTDLPTLDLVLRLMCRTDSEWREARHQLVTASPLIQHELLHFAPSYSDSLLNCPLKLTTPLVNFLLAEQPTHEELETLLTSRSAVRVRSHGLHQTTSTVTWSDLVLPDSLTHSVQYLAQRFQGQTEAQARWGIQPGPPSQPGTIALFSGATGTGKTMAAAAIASALHLPLHTVDLSLVAPEEYAPLLQDILEQSPPILLLKSAQLWFGRSSQLPASSRHQLIAQRQQVQGLTLLTVHHATAIQSQWRRRLDQVLEFPMPNACDRLRLWHRAFPSGVSLDSQISWEALAEQLPLTGQDIAAIAYDAVRYAAALQAEQVEMQHLVYVLAQRGKSLKFDSPVSFLPTPSATTPTDRKPTRSRKAKKSQTTATAKNIPNIRDLPKRKQTG